MAKTTKNNASDAIVKSAETNKKEVAPGKLYSLSKLEGVLGKKFKMSINESLAVVQSLYEAGYVTYPRTDTEYMATAEKGKVKSEVVGAIVSRRCPDANSFSLEIPRCVLPRPPAF